MSGALTEPTTPVRWVTDMLHFEWSQLPSIVLLGAFTFIVVYVIQHREGIHRLIFHPLPFKGIPMNIKPKFFFGHMHLYGKEQISGMKKLMVDPADPKTGLSSFYLLGTPVVSVLRAQDAKTVLLNSNYRDSLPLLEKHFYQFLGPKGITTLMNKEWKDHRREISRGFEHSILKNNVPHFSAVSNNICKTIINACQSNPNGFITKDVFPLMKKVTLDAFGLTALNYRFDCTDSFGVDKVAAAFEFLLDEMCYRMFDQPLNPALYFYSLPTERNKKWHAANNVVNDLLRELVANQKQAMKENSQEDANATTGGSSKNMLTTLLNKTDGGAGLSDAALIDNLKTFFFAGFDTTAITLSYALYLLSQAPEWTEKIVAEVRDVLEVDANAPNVQDRLKTAIYDDVAQLKVTEAVVKETLRLYPSAQVTSRTNLKEITLAGTKIPPGTTLMVPIWHIQRSPHNWKDPEEFRPTRFIVDGIDAKAGSRANSEGAHPYSWIPFSGGQRNCVGQRFAMLEAVVSLATIVYHLDFKFTRDAKKEPLESRSSSFVQKPVGGIPMHLSPRNPI